MEQLARCPKCNAEVQLLGGDRRRPWLYCRACGWSNDKLLNRAIKRQK